MRGINMLSDIKNKILGLSSDYTFYKTNYEIVSEENRRLKEEIKNLRDEKDSFILKVLSSQDDLNSNLDAIRKENIENTYKILSQDTKEDEILDKISEISQNINSTQLSTRTQFEELKKHIHTMDKGILTGIDEVKSGQNNLFDNLSQNTKEDEILDKISEISQSINSTQLSTRTRFEELKNEIRTRDDITLAKIGEVNSGQNELFNSLLRENERIIDALLSNQEHFSRNLKRNYDLLTGVEELALKVEKSSAYTNIKLDSKFDDNNRLLENYSNRICEKIAKESK